MPTLEALVQAFDDERDRHPNLTITLRTWTTEVAEGRMPAGTVRAECTIKAQNNAILQAKGDAETVILDALRFMRTLPPPSRPPSEPARPVAPVPAATAKPSSTHGFDITFDDAGRLRLVVVKVTESDARAAMNHARNVLVYAENVATTLGMAPGAEVRILLSGADTPQRTETLASISASLTQIVESKRSAGRTIPGVMVLCDSDDDTDLP